jgi:hypothetical protein
VGKVRDSGKGFRSWAVGSLVAILVALGTSAAMGETQRIGPRDSPTYLSSAESLAEGGAYQTPFGDRGKEIDFESTVSPVVDFPPGLPFMLSLGVRAGLSVEDAGRLVTILCTAAIGVLFFAFARARSRSILMGVVFGLLASAFTMRLTFGVVSEGLYGLLISAALIAGGSFLRSHQGLWFAAAAGLAIASVTVRTAGLALVAVVALTAWVGFDRIVPRIMALVGVPLAGVGVFYQMTGSGNRVVAWHPPDLTSVKVATDATVSFFLPPFANPTVRLIVFAGLLVALALWILKAGPSGQRSRFGWVSPELLGVWAAIAQLSLLAATRALFDAQTDPSFRLLYPVALSLLLSVVEISSISAVSGRFKRARGVLVSLSIVALATATWQVVSAASDGTNESLAFASPEFVASPGVDLIRELAQSAPVFSNIPDGLWVAGVDGARAIPIAYDPLSLEASPRIAAEMSRLQTELQESGALVFYHRTFDFEYLVGEADLLAIAPCVVMDDGDSVAMTAVGSPFCTP